jgi:hypothetical protein
MDVTRAFGRFRAKFRSRRDDEDYAEPVAAPAIPDPTYQFCGQNHEPISYCELDNQLQSTFFRRLPLEIRTMIYREAFMGETIRHIVYEDRHLRQGLCMAESTAEEAFSWRKIPENWTMGHYECKVLLDRVTTLTSQKNSPLSLLLTCKRS